MKKKSFRNFPWFATFEQNKPNLIKLKAEQVTLLSQYTSWTVTNAAGRDAIEKTMGPVLR